MKRINFALQFIVKLAKRYWYTSLISVIVASSIVFLSLNLSYLVPKYIPSTTYIGLVGRHSLDTMPQNVSSLISHGLTEILPNKRATSSPIVSNWTINAEGKEYTFYIKDNIYWQDGEPLTADQIHLPFKGAEFSSLPGRVIIKLDSPFSPLPSFLTTPLFKNNQIGLGEYKIKRLETQAGAISSLLLVNTGSKNDRIAINFYPTEEDLITAFELGKIDQAWGITDVDRFSNWKNIEIKSETGINTSYTAFFINTRNEPLDSRRIRQALAYCLQKPLEKDRAISPIYPTSWAFNETVKTYRYDPRHGKALLEEDWDPKEKISLKLVTLPELLNWAENAKEDWENNLNVEVRIQVSNFVPNVNDFDIFLGYGIIPPDPDQYLFWHSTQSENLTGINNPKIDQLLQDGRRTIDIQERKEIYLDFQKTLLEESPAIFLYFPQNYTLVRK